MITDKHLQAIQAADFLPISKDAPWSVTSWRDDKYLAAVFKRSQQINVLTSCPSWSTKSIEERLAALQAVQLDYTREP